MTTHGQIAILEARLQEVEEKIKILEENTFYWAELVHEGLTELELAVARHDHAIREIQQQLDAATWTAKEPA